MFARQGAVVNGYGLTPNVGFLARLRINYQLTINNPKSKISLVHRPDLRRQIGAKG